MGERQSDKERGIERRERETEPEREEERERKKEKIGRDRQTGR